MAPHTEITLSSGHTVTVELSLEEVEKGLSDASRSGGSRLAWFAEDGRGRVGVNPSQVTILRENGD